MAPDPGLCVAPHHMKTGLNASQEWRYVTDLLAKKVLARCKVDTCRTGTGLI